ncbi:transglycosylase domain-containing protein [Ruegeria sp. A3M17]|uniref:transglycosylase domain-containing protein n=1 Tax=Ruegeria sp. A3M17 TaxID=2267229 RepID=UPI000DEA31B5|nr:transglycosylase domain-containing protein [Ruegeria sp. A3M17]RBW53856.1 hypothetical protein DS906_18155 [Ruegeria sp. A3M17]
MGRLFSLVTLLTSILGADAGYSQSAVTGLPSSGEIIERYQDDTRGRHPVPVLLQKVMVGMYDPDFFRTELPQYSRTTLKASERVRSVREVRKTGVLANAFAVSNTLSREEIVNWHTNTVYWGRSCYRPNDAALVYFGKEIDGLSLGEIAYLAGIVIAPSHFDPERHPDRAIERRNATLKELAKTSFFSEDEIADAVLEDLDFVHPLGKCDRPRDR